MVLAMKLVPALKLVLALKLVPVLKLIGPVFGRPEQSEAPVPACGGLPHVIVYLSKSWISEMAVYATELRKPVGDRSSVRRT